MKTPYGALLRYFRELRGYSQREFAELIGSSNKALSAVETGRIGPHEGENLERVRRSLGLEPDEYKQLVVAANSSSLLVRIPRGTPPEKIALIHSIVSRLAELNRTQMTIIQKTVHDL